jgi:adenylate kinase family enzyme
MSQTMQPNAILLIGPTGSGKTPLGEFLEANGLNERRCAHFDFGSELRAAAAQREVRRLSGADLAFVRKCLAEGALLENETFHIAEALFANFLELRDIGAQDLLVLNGLPRHSGQAAAVDRLAKVVLVAMLECDAQTTIERISANAGGDRVGRTDDDPDSVRRKLAAFAERTRPLVNHYRGSGVPILTLNVEVSTTPQMMAAQLARQGVEVAPCH